MNEICADHFHPVRARPVLGDIAALAAGQEVGQDGGRADLVRQGEEHRDRVGRSVGRQAQQL